MVVRTLGFRLRLRLRPDWSLPASLFRLRFQLRPNRSSYDRTRRPNRLNSQFSVIKQKIK